MILVCVVSLRCHVSLFPCVHFQGLIPQMIEAVNHRINKKLRFGYDVGKGYITGEEEVQNFIEVMIDNKKIIKEIKDKVNKNRLDIMKELGEWR